MNRCQDTESVAPRDDCVITIVVIGAQYVCGSLNTRPTSIEATAVTAVRAECSSTCRLVAPIGSVGIVNRAMYPFSKTSSPFIVWLTPKDVRRKQMILWHHLFNTSSDSIYECRRPAPALAYSKLS